MGYYDADCYYQPEKFGLKIVGEINDPQASYSFNDLVVWQHEDGRLFYAEDSGCSCPSPFETYNSIDDLTPITNETWAEFQTAVENHALPYHWRKDEPAPVDQGAADKTDLLRKVSELLR